MDAMDPLIDDDAFDDREVQYRSDHSYDDASSDNLSVPFSVADTISGDFDLGRFLEREYPFVRSNEEDRDSRTGFLQSKFAQHRTDVREELRSRTDKQGKRLYEDQHVEDYLAVHHVPPPHGNPDDDPGDETFGQIGLVCYFGLRSDQFSPHQIPISSMLKGKFPSPLVPKFTWIHLPVNNLEWVYVSPFPIPCLRMFCDL